MPGCLSEAEGGEEVGGDEGFLAVGGDVNAVTQWKENAEARIVDRNDVAAMRIGINMTSEWGWISRRTTRARGNSRASYNPADSKTCRSARPPPHQRS